MTRKYIAFVLGAMALLIAGAGTATAASPGVQVADQSADSAQQATSASGATQVAPSNSNISIRVLSPGSDGAVSQSNTASSTATSSNANEATQGAGQTQSGAGIQTAQQYAGNAQASKCALERLPDRGDQQEHRRPGAEPGRQRPRHAVERRKLDGDLHEREHGRPDVGSEPIRYELVRVCSAASAPAVRLCSAAAPAVRV